jgi:hypothetical protein
MRTSWILTSLVVAVACGWFGHQAFSEDAPPAMPNEAEMEKLMAELGTPGAHHKWLETHAGAWTLAVKSYGQDGKVEESTATAELKMILGGRFQVQEFHGTFQGKPFDGFGLTGYDNAKKEFVNYWFDSMTTAPSFARGQRSDDGKTLTLSGVWDLPNMSMPFKYVSTMKSEKEMSFSMTGTFGGQEMPMMEATYTRK